MSATPEPEPEPVRATLQLSGRRLSYLDSGGPGPLLLALHGHFGEARTFAPLARQLAPDWRVVALDQRGHGHSGRPPDFSREGYVEDTAAVLHHLGGPGPAVVLGHSLGGVNAYHLAARHPRLSVPWSSRTSAPKSTATCRSASPGRTAPPPGRRCWRPWAHRPPT